MMQVVKIKNLEGGKIDLKRVPSDKEYKSNRERARPVQSPASDI